MRVRGAWRRGAWGECELQGQGEGGVEAGGTQDLAKMADVPFQ